MSRISEPKPRGVTEGWGCSIVTIAVLAGLVYLLVAVGVPAAKCFVDGAGQIKGSFNAFLRGVQESDYAAACRHMDLGGVAGPHSSVHLL